MGVRGDAGEIQGDGDAGRQGGGGRGACRRAAATHSAYWPGEEGDRELGGVGRPLGPHDGLHR